MKIEQNNSKRIHRSLGLLSWVFLCMVLTVLVSQRALAQPNVSDLVVSPPFSGGTIKWYTASSGDNQITNPAGTNLVHGTTYYASQTVNDIESTERRAITVNITSVPAPTVGTHSATETSVTWNWNVASGATGYKWNTTNNYGTAVDLGNVLTVTQTSLTCNTGYTIYVWAYNSSGCVSNATTLTQTTSTCGSGDAIYDALSTSKTSYASASANDLVKITAAEYASVKSALSTTTIGYTLSIDDNWATSSASANTTFSYNGNSNDNTIRTFTALNYPVAFTFHPALNPAASYTCQLKYNDSGTLTNISKQYSGATVAVNDRQYFVIKTPTQLPNATPYIALYTSSGIGTISSTNSTYWDYAADNLIGSQSFTSQIGANTQLPSIQILETATKLWP